MLMLIILLLVVVVIIKAHHFNLDTYHHYVFIIPYYYYGHHYWCYNYYYRPVYIIHYWEFLNLRDPGPRAGLPTFKTNGLWSPWSPTLKQRPPGPKSHHHMHQGQNMVYGVCSSIHIHPINPAEIQTGKHTNTRLVDIYDHPYKHGFMTIPQPVDNPLGSCGCKPLGSFKKNGGTWSHHGFQY